MAKPSMEERMVDYEKKVQKALDYAEIQNVFALHEYYHHVPTKEFDMLFAQKQPDVSFGQNQGMWVGRDLIGRTTWDGPLKNKKRASTNCESGTRISLMMLNMLHPAKLVSTC
jgi:hypothetical protein